MTAPRAFTDEELTAFLDGEADDELHAAIDAALETDAALLARAEALFLPPEVMGAMAQGYDALLDTAPAMAALPEPVAPPARRRRSWAVLPFGVGLAAGLAVAAFVGLSTPEPAPARGWVSFVASYQALYTTATLADAAPTAAETTAQLVTVSQAVGLDLTGLPEAAGLTFKRAQVLGFNGKPLVQIAFLRDDGTPVALCIIPAGPDAKPVNMGAAEGLGLARWNTPGHGFLLIGGTDAAPLEAEAETFADWAEDIAT
ncbi:hypothetical protein [uncultured Tateyamaria sp.]|uniref:anti-sigma factor family protein n=1 Tax=uncultured Tateyamaria sp. TaxID=455651 RepID=UPI0026056208|nr:hypothetical protein [uncultured Tateyamaria sp.]